MIPKKIHYCWFGGNPLSELAQKCIASWKKFCPEYEIVEWNETNFDINYNVYTKEAYEAKKWAFVSDVARLYALVNFGGIYMDTDVEVLKSLNNLLCYNGILGFEDNIHVSTSLMACSAEHLMFTEFLDEYKNIHFKINDGKYDNTTNVVRISKICLKYGLIQNNTLQTINNLTFLPKDYFCPKDFETGCINITENSYSIHHFDSSWLCEYDRKRIDLRRKILNAKNPIKKFFFWLKLETYLKIENNIKKIINYKNKK